MPDRFDLEELARNIGGEITEISGPLPDGSGFAVMSMPLPENHWIYEEEMEPPAPLRMGTGELRSILAEIIRKAGKYAVRGSTMNGKEMDFDPDAMLQNLVVGFLGYWTEDGYSHLDDDEPD